VIVRLHSNSLRVLTVIAFLVIEVSAVSAQQSRMTPNEDKDFNFNKSTGAITAYIGTDSRVVIPERIDGKAVSQIAQQAFKGNKVIKDVIIPAACQTIGKEAFMDSSLRSITVNSTLVNVGNGAFQGTKELQTFISNWGSRVTKIPPYLHSDGGVKGELKIPDKVTEIGAYAFANTAITGVTLPSSIRVIGEYAFSGCNKLAKVNFPEGLTQIGDYAFEDTALTGITLPSSLRVLGNGAFSGCSKLTKTNIPAKITEISARAFANTAITSVTLPSSLKVIWDEAFAGTKITSITLPASIKNIGNYAFYECKSLSKVNIPSGIDEIGAGVFQSTGITSITLPSSIKSIGGNAFSGCNKLASINFPEGLTVIWPNAFWNTALTSVTLPSSIKTIGDNAFSSCKLLASVTVHSNVKSITFGDAVFSGSNSLSTESRNKLKALGYKGAF